MDVPGLERLLDIIASGVGGIAGPMMAPWRARREREATLIRAQGEAEVLRIRAQAQADARRLLVDPSYSVKGEMELGDLIRQRIEYQERKRQANIVAVAHRAAVEVGESHAPAVEPDHDWTARFFGDVQDVSSEDMQVLWGRVLAGEVQNPGQTSKRTLGILKDLDADTAGMFSRLCSAAVFAMGSDGEIIDARVPSLGRNAADNALRSFGLDYSVWNRLNEHGLIIPDYNSYFEYVISQEPSSSGTLLRHQNADWDVEIEDKDRIRVLMRLDGVAMTVAGHELSRVVSQEPFGDFTEAMKAFIQRRFHLQLGRIRDAHPLFDRS